MVIPECGVCYLSSIPCPEHELVWLSCLVVPESVLEYVPVCLELLVDEGRLIINTPNIFNPSRFWLDATHKVAYSYEELGGVLLSQGFDVVGIYRTFNASFIKYLLRKTLYYPLHRILNVDFAKSILVLAQKGR